YVEWLLHAEKSGVAVYSSDLILLNANQTYIKYLNEPYNKKEYCIGKKINEIVKGYKDSIIEEIWTNLLKTGEPYFASEAQYDMYDRGITYWDSSIIPVCENEKVKYFIENAVEVTERVLSRKRLEEQNAELRRKAELLKIITENMNDALIIINKDGTYEYFNEFAKKFMQQGNLEKAGDILSSTTFYDENGNRLTIDNMPGAKVLTGEKIENVIIRAKRADLPDAYFTFSGSPVYDADGKVIFGVLCFREVTERCKLELEIMERKDQLEAVFETMTDILMVCDNNGNIISMNSLAKCSLYPYDKVKNIKDLYSDNIYQYIDNGNNPVPLDEMPHKRVSRGEKVSNLKMKVKRPDKDVYLDANASPVFDDKGNLIMIVMCCHDITDLIEREQKLIEQNEIIKQQKELLEATIENMNDAVAIFDSKGSIVLTNVEARRLYPHITTRSKAGNVHDGFQFFDIQSNNIIPLNGLPTRRVLRGEKIRNETIKFKFNDGMIRVIEVNAVPIYDNENKLVSAVVTHHDVTRMVEYEENTRKQKELLESIIDSLYENLFVIGRDGRYLIHKNNIIKEISTKFDSIEEIFSAAKYYDMDGNQLSLERMPAYRVKCGETVKDEIMNIKVGDQEYYLIVNGSPIFDKSGGYLYGVGSSSDITQFVRNQKVLGEIQEQLLKVEREKNEALENSMKMKDDFLATITHEFKTPLTVINAALQTIEALYESQLSDKVKKHLQRIHTNSLRQMRLVNNLLDITLYNAGHLKFNKKNMDIIFLTSTIVKSVDLYAKQKDTEIKFSTDCRSKEMAIDEEKYERILLNLLSNAIKFTPKGRLIYVNISCKDKKIVITVKDNGVGIPKDKLKLIFECFGQVDSSLTRQAEGTGIGLSLVKTLVEGMNGTITVESEVGKGSTFVVTLPITRLKRMMPETNIVDLKDRRITNAAAIEFSDIYMG
ncbi:MAG TPA: ATP-binding protein, partial [Clostridia bacterium]